MCAEYLSTDFVTVNFRQLFNYDDGLYSHGGTQDMDIDAIGGSFDLDALDTVQMDRARVVQVDADLDGRGSNMALIIFFESDFVRPVTLQGLLVYFSRTGLSPKEGLLHDAAREGVLVVWRAWMGSREPFFVASRAKKLNIANRTVLRERWGCM